MSDGEENKLCLVQNWSALALWSLDVRADICAICRNPIDDICIECEARVEPRTVLQCLVASGACNHDFHYHCISHWLKKRGVCPLDYATWVYRMNDD